MVNYLYELDDIETNHEAFATRNEVVASNQVRRYLRKTGNGRATGRRGAQPRVIANMFPGEANGAERKESAEDGGA